MRRPAPARSPRRTPCGQGPTGRRREDVGVGAPDRPSGARDPRRLGPSGGERKARPRIPVRRSRAEPRPSGGSGHRPDHRAPDGRRRPGSAGARVAARAATRRGRDAGAGIGAGSPRPLDLPVQLRPRGGVGDAGGEEVGAWVPGSRLSIQSRDWGPRHGQDHHARARIEVHDGEDAVALGRRRLLHAEEQRHERPAKHVDPRSQPGDDQRLLDPLRGLREPLHGLGKDVAGEALGHALGVLRPGGFRSSSSKA